MYNIRAPGRDKMLPMAEELTFDAESSTL